MFERKRFNFDNICSLVWINEDEQEKVLIECDDSDEVEILIETKKYFTAKKVFDKNCKYLRKRRTERGATVKTNKQGVVTT